MTTHTSKSARFSALFVITAFFCLSSAAKAAEEEKLMKEIVTKERPGNYFYLGNGTSDVQYSVAREKQGPYDEIAVTNGGTIKGRLKFTGPVPKLAPLKVKDAPDMCGEEAENEALVVGENGGVKYGIAFLASVPRGKPKNREAVTAFDLIGCRFTPHVVSMTKNGIISGLNSDKVEHNLEAYVDDGLKFSLTLYVDGPAKSGRIPKVGFLEVTCDLHYHMRSWGMVFAHPYHSVTDDDGNFTLDNIPPGKYTLKVWHENWKTDGKVDHEGRIIYAEPILLSKEVEVKAGETQQVDFEIFP